MTYKIGQMVKILADDDKFTLGRVVGTATIVVDEEQTYYAEVEVEANSRPDAIEVANLIEQSWNPTDYQITVEVEEVPTYYAYPGFDCSGVLKPADYWFWQGNQWMAVEAGAHADWWEGAEPTDTRPRIWKLPITQVPLGNLIYRDAQGNEINRSNKRLSI